MNLQNPFPVNALIINCCCGWSMWNCRNNSFQCKYCGQNDGTKFVIELQIELLQNYIKKHISFCTRCHRQNCPIHFDQSNHFNQSNHDNQNISH